MSFELLTPTEIEVVDLYIAAYGRVPAQSGLDFFTNALDSSLMTEEDVQDYMMNNTEATNRYPSSNSYTDNVQIVFENVLGRAPATEEGLDFWASKFEDPSYTMSDLMVDVLNEAKNNPTDDQTLTDREAAASYFLDTIPADYQSNNQITVSNIVDAQTLETAKDQIDDICKTVLDVNYSYDNYTLGELSNYDTYGVDTLDSRFHWEDTSTITYSFDTSIPDDYYDYSDSSLVTDWAPLDLEQQNATRDIIDGLNSMLGITLQEVSNDGMIEFNVVQMDSSVAGFAFYPGDDYSYEGDVFLSQDFNLAPDDFGLDAGEFGSMTIAHELGHALGLKHPFEGFYTLPESVDDTNHTVMSYTSKENYVPDFSLSGSTLGVEYTPIYPQLYSVYDIATLQAIYGVNSETNTTDDVYTMKYDDYSIVTIWDSGGVDIIDLSQTTGKDTIDMHSGSVNNADEQTLLDIVEFHQQEIDDAYFDDWIEERIDDLYVNDQLYMGRENLSIADGVIIENLYTGTGDDVVTDNEVDNQIYTGAGDDSIYVGSGGYDYVDAGIGQDTLYIDAESQDLDLSQLKDGTYLVIMNNYAINFVGIEYIHTNDTIISL